MSHRSPVRTDRKVSVLVLIAVGALLSGCGRTTTAPAEDEAGDDAAAIEPEPATLSFGERRARREHGRQLYVAECSGCHGERGLGDGPAAEAIDPKPRNLVREPFKFRSTASRKPPVHADIVETISRGMPGSAMPAFEFLTEEERGLLAEHVMYLARIDTAPVSELMPIGAETPATNDSVERGHAVYKRLECHMCHGEDGHGDGPSAPTLKDEQGRKIEARDFRLGLFRRGRTAAELYRTFETGIDGTSMPSYSGNYTNAEAWDLARYILSLPTAPAAPPTDAVAHGRQIVEEKQCFACHVIEGRGGVVGPSLDVSAKKLRFDWIKTFLEDPRAAGAIYPFRPYRMPDLGLEADEIEAVLALLAEVAGREYPEAPEPVPAIDPDVAAAGTLFYVIKCAECHNLGSVIPTPLAKQQGPDLINVSQRLRFDWIADWVANPLSVYPGTAMVDTNLTDEEIEGVRAFLWKTSTEAASH
ncbi:MAG: c-type cytochrome [bacterium]|nr:c-type cytochrome [bacterium]